jgi:YVTN family beta-propeller protein
VTSEQANTVSVIDARAQQFVATIQVGARPRGVVFSADGARALRRQRTGRLGERDRRAHAYAATRAGDPCRPTSNLRVQLAHDADIGGRRFRKGELIDTALTSPAAA